MKTSLLLLLMAGLVFGGCRGLDPGADELETGIRFLEQGRNEKSLRFFEAAMEKLTDEQQKAIAHNCAGIAYWRLGRRDMAALAFETSKDMNPAFADPVYNMGVLMAESEDSSAAIELFEKAAALDPADPRALEYLAQVYVRAGDRGKAAAILEKALARAPRSPRILTALSVLDLEAGDVQKSVAGLQRALENDAGYLPAIYNLGVLNERWLKNNEQALAYFKEHASRSSGAPDSALSTMKIKDIEAEMLLAKAGETVPSVEQAAQHVSERIAETGPDCGSAAAEMVSHRKKSKDVEVVAQAGPPVSAYEERVSAADQLKRQGRLEAAVYNYLKAAALAEKDGEQDRAEDAVRMAASAVGRNARAHYLLGSHFRKRQLNDDALAHFRTAMEIDPRWPAPCLAMAEILAERGENDAAVVCLKHADRAQPAEPDALWMLALLYDERMCLTSHAAQCYSSFSLRFPDDPRAEKARARQKALE